MKRRSPVVWLIGLTLLLVSALRVTAVSPTQAPLEQITTPGSPAPDSILVVPTYTGQVVELVNQERWDNGQLPPLKAVDLLDNIALGPHDCRRL